MNLDTKYSVLFSKNSININYKILNLVYLPIIKSDSYTLYNLISSQRNLKNVDLSFLKNFFGFKLGFIKDSLKILEAISLLKTFYNKDDNEIIFFILEPLSFENFLKNRKLKKLLIRKTSKNYLDFISKQFMEYNTNLKNFEDISTSFKYEIFEENDLMYENDDNFIKTNLSHNDLDDSNDNSNSTFLNKTASGNVDLSGDKNLNVYNLKNFTNNMQNSNSNNIINNNHYISYFGNNFTADTFQIFKDNKLKKIHIEPGEYFENLKGAELNEYDRNLIAIATVKYKLKFEVINCLIEYIYLTNNKVINEAYFSKIAESLSIHNILNANDALIYLERAFILSKNIETKNLKINNNSEKINDSKNFNFLDSDLSSNFLLPDDSNFDQEAKKTLLSF